MIIAKAASPMMIMPHAMVNISSHICSNVESLPVSLPSRALPHWGQKLASSSPGELWGVRPWGVLSQLDPSPLFREAWV